MKSFLIVLSLALLSFAPDHKWNSNFSTAQQNAQSEHKFILLNFSGSDWCGPCIRMKKEIFDSPEFQEFALKELVLVNADFPRQKKNKLSKEQQVQNDQLADKYNQAGLFPNTILLNEKGEVLKSWQGFQNQGTTAFISEIKALTDAPKK